MHISLGADLAATNQAIEKLLRMQLRNHPEYGSPLYRQYLI